MGLGVVYFIQIVFPGCKALVFIANCVVIRYEKI